MKVNNLQLSIKLTIENPKSESTSAFGPGIAALCEGVQETGSLNAAAKGLGMAYSKAWRIMKDTEGALGVQMLIRDGAHGSTLTPDCVKLLNAYHTLQERLQKKAETDFQKLLSKK